MKQNPTDPTNAHAYNIWYKYMNTRQDGKMEMPLYEHAKSVPEFCILPDNGYNNGNNNIMNDAL